MKDCMKKIISLLTASSFFFLLVPAVYAQTAEVNQVVNFVKNTNQLLLIVAAALAGSFVILGSITYITSSGNPENLEKGKKTITFSLIGLVLAFAASLLVSIVTQLATKSFGS